MEGSAEKYFDVMKETRITRGYEHLMELRKSQLLDDYQEIEIESPKILAVYFKNDSEEIESNIRFLYFREPKAKSYPLDLQSGFSGFQKRRPMKLKERLCYVEHYLLKSPSDLLENKELERPIVLEGAGTKTIVPPNHTTILTTSRVLSQIMFLPHRMGATNIVICATKYCGTICLILPSFQYKQNIETKDFHHYKLQQYCFTDKFDVEPITTAPINNNEHYVGIYGTSVNHFNIVYSGEFGWVNSDVKIEKKVDTKMINNMPLVMTKTLLRDYTQNYTFKYRIWWLQAYLAHMNEVFIGIKDSDGLVRTHLEQKKTQELLQDTNMNPMVLHRFLYKFLHLVETKMSDVNCPHTVYEFQYNPTMQSIECKVHGGETDLSFLSEQFMQHLKNRSTQQM